MDEPSPPRTSVTQRAIDSVKSMIAGGVLHAGDRLPTERELAAELGISRNSMREAIRALTVLGILETKHGSGIYVTQLDAASLLETFGVVADLSQGTQLMELLEVRKVLESHATALAAARIDDRQLKAVSDLLKEMEETEEPEEALRLDLMFHRAIVAACGNPTLAALLDGLSTNTFRARAWRGIQEEGAFARTRREHASVYRALAARDPEAARTAAAAHVGEVENWLRSQLSR
ncbi:FadR/GntR family transcriptional regulator [Streptomyces californicus]|uniref:FadR/GntR family transcriptional regulator n=1 Tax=Streptomyces californicus TaxID=67351 RepID=UPI00378821A5